MLDTYHSATAVDVAGLQPDGLRGTQAGGVGGPSTIVAPTGGGQQQRVAVARTIVLEPQVLLFDEPLSNLDAKLRRRVREEIRDFQQELKLTVAYVTHDQEDALAVSDRIIVMNAGKIAQDGTPRQLYNQPDNRFIADFMGDANLIPVTVADGRRACRGPGGTGAAESSPPRRTALPAPC